MNFTEKLKQLMYENEFTQQQLADRTGVPRPTISLWLTNRSKPRDRALRKLSDFFHIPLEILKDDSRDLSDPLATYHKQITIAKKTALKMYPDDMGKAQIIFDETLNLQTMKTEMDALKQRVYDLEKSLKKLAAAPAERRGLTAAEKAVSNFGTEKLLAEREKKKTRGKLGA